MRHFIHALAAGVLLLSSCSASEIQETARRYEYSFAIDETTKALLSEDDIITWENGDMVGTYAEGTSNLESAVNAGNPATFSISLNSPLKAGDMLYFYYPYNENSASDPSQATLVIPTQQKGDMSSMAMATLPYAVSSALANGEELAHLSFRNLGSVIEFHIYSEDEDIQEEVVESISFESESALAGEFSFDLTSVSDEESLALEGLTGKSVTMIPETALTVGSDKGNGGKALMIVAPGTYSGKITVHTDKYDYEYAISEKSFSRSAIKPLNINLSEEKRVDTQVYRQVSSVGDVKSGEYVIAAKYQGAYYAIPNSLTITSKKVKAEEVTVTDGYVTMDNGEDYVVTLTVSGNQVSISNGNSYLSSIPNSTTLANASEEFNWYLSAGGTEYGTFRIANDNNSRGLLYKSDTKLFGFYSTSNFSNDNAGIYYDVELFKLGSLVEKPAEPSIITGDASMIGTNDAILSATFYNATSTPSELRFEYGTERDQLNSTIYYNDIVPANGTPFSVTLSSLSENTNYYFRAAMQVGTKDYYGEVVSFKTASSTVDTNRPKWLEMPAVIGDEDYVGTFYRTGSLGENRNYSYNYSYSNFCSMWTAYPLTYDHTQGSAKTGIWSFNPNIPSQYQIDVTSGSYPSKYSADSYARGHNIPNADRKSDATMNSHTYYLTNQVPQIQNSFNDGIWSSLEGGIRSLTSKTDTVYVVTGVCFRKTGGSETINYLESTEVNPPRIPVANYFWKVLLKVKRTAGQVTSAKAIGVWFDHKAYSSTSYSNYAVSVDQIEEWTGFDFFVNLDESLATSAEKNTSWSDFSNF